MRLPSWFFALSSLLCACGSAERTPPVVAAPVSAPDRESAPSGRLPDDSRPDRYALTLDVDPSKSTFRGEVTIALDLARPRDTLWLHARKLRVAKVRVTPAGGTPLEGVFEQVGESGLAAIRLAQPVGPGKVEATLAFDGDFGTRLSGLYKVESGGAPYVFTQFEAISAREAFPCLDEPRFKAPLALTLRVPKGQQALANTQPASERELTDGQRELTFTPTEKLPSYLYALAVGPLDVVSAPALVPSALRDHELPLRGVAVRGRGADLAYALRGTPALVSWLEQYFGVAYAYDKLDLIAVPDFAAGAMENAGAITFRDTLLLVRDDAAEAQKRKLAYVNAHELAHQWFGNLVTMPWWDDIWLNEAFATWMGGKAVGAVHPDYDADLGALIATHGAMDLDGNAAARKIRQPIESEHDIANAFDAITYSKGGAVLSMFEGYLGAERFQRGLQAYMQRYRFGSATAKDLVHTLAETAGEPALEPAFFSFLDQPGVPEIQVQVDCKSNPPALVLEQARYLPLGSEGDRAKQWQVPVCVRYGVQGSKNQQQCALIGEANARLPLETESCPRWVLPNAGARSYYRWTLPERELAQLLAARAELTTREQMSLASNALAGLRAGRVAPAAALSIARALATAPQRQVVETALQTFTLAYELLDDETRPVLRREVAKLLMPAYRKLGLTSSRAEAEVDGGEKLSREQVVRALFHAEEPTVTRALARAGRALIEAPTQPTKLPPELRDLSLSAALREGDAALFTAAEQQLFASEEGSARTRLLTGLSAVRTPELATRALALSLDARLRTNERLVPLLVQAADPRMRRSAFAWLQTNFDALAAQIGAHGSSQVIGVTARFCSDEDARAVEAFFTTRSGSVSGGPRALAQSLEAIRGCAALSQAHSATLRTLYRPARAARTDALSARP